MSNQPQKLNVIDEQNNIIGEDTRENIHKHGLLHREIHIWFYTPHGEVIFQLRGRDKDTYPNLLDATVGGHVELSQSFEEAALMEMQEETGIEGQTSNLTLIETTRSKNTDPVTGNTNNALRAVYAYKYTSSIENLKVENDAGAGFEAWPIEQVLYPTEEQLKRVIPALLGPDYRKIFSKIAELI